MLLALAQQPQGTQPAWMQFVFIGGMALMFYFLLIRPQNKARKETEARLAKLQAGDEVVLTSGLFATIDRVEEKVIWLKLGGCLVKARRAAVAALASEGEPQSK